MSSTRESIQLVNQYAAARQWKPLVHEAILGSEVLLQNAVLASLPALADADRTKVLAAIIEIGKGRDLRKFQFGDLARLLRQTRFLDLWEKTYSPKLAALKVVDLEWFVKVFKIDEVVKLRNNINHPSEQEFGETQAVIAFGFFKACVDAFSDQQGSLPIRETFLDFVPTIDTDLKDPLPGACEPFRLLTWKTNLTSFVGREQEINTLLRWVCDSGTHPRAWLLTGNGGAGKTKLAANICKQLRESGWTAQFLQPKEVPVLHDRPSLYVIDYPEERKDDISSLFALINRVEKRNTPLRLLFLTRKNAEWWVNFLLELHVVTQIESGEIQLGKLDKEDAAKLFQEAYKRVRDHYNLRVPDIADADIHSWYSRNEQLNSSPLFILATAIHCALDEDPSLSLGGAQVIQALVKRECARLVPAGRAAGFKKDAGPRLKALAGIAGRIEAATLERLADPELQIGLLPRLDVVDAVRQTALWVDDSIPAASPDICAAALLFSVLKERPDLAPNWLWAVMQDVRRGAPDLLGRLARDISLTWPPVSTAHAQRNGSNGHQTPPAREFVQWLIKMLNQDPHRAMELEGLLTEFRPPISVLPIAVEVGFLLTRSPDLDERKHAEWLHCLAERLWESGRYKDALGPIESAVALRRRLSQEDPIIEVDLGKSLNSYALILSGLHRDDDAAKAVNEGVDILRRGASEDNVESLHALGRCLNAKNNIFAGRAKVVAREAATEVVSIYRMLCRKAPDRFEIWLARGFHNLSNTEDDLRAAAATLSEAVEIKRRLAEKSSWRYEHEFALSASLMVKRLLGLEKNSEASLLSKEVVTIYSRLYEVNPIQFAGDYAGALSVQVHALRKLLQKEEAVDSENKLLGVMENLISIQEDAIDDQQLTQLLYPLVTMANNASHSGRPEDARIACDKALEIAAAIELRNPDVWNPALHLAIRAAHLNRGNARRLTERKEAMEDYSVAIRMSDELEARSGVDEQNIVVRSLAQINLAMEMFEDNRQGDAIAMTKAGIAGEQRLCTQFGEGHYAGQEDQLLMSFDRLIDYLIPLAELDLTANVARILVRLAKTTGDMVEGESSQDVANRLAGTGESLMKAGFTEEGITMLRQGADIAQKVVTESDGFSDVEFLNNLGYYIALIAEHDNQLSELDRAESHITSAAALVNADEDYLRLITLDSHGYILTLRGKSLNSASILMDAISKIDESCQLARKLDRNDLLPTAEQHLADAQAALKVAL